MSDCQHQAQREQNARRLIAAFVVILTFMVVEAIGGVISGSLALLADATHMFTDAFALGLAASAQYIAGRPADARRHFGYRRAQVLAAFVNGVVLCVLLLWIVYEAVMRLFNPIDIDASTMLVVAMLGFGANVVAFFILHNAQHSDVNIRGAMLHVIGDLLGSVAAVVGAIVIMTAGWRQIDPLLSILVAVLIARSAMRLIRETGHILLEGAPEHIDVDALIEGVKSAAPEVEDVHDVHIWQLTPGHARLTLHARVRDPDVADSALSRIKTYLEEEHGIARSTVQIEVGQACPDETGEGASVVAARATFVEARHRHAPDHRHGAALAAGHK